MSSISFCPTLSWFSYQSCSQPEESLSVETILEAYKSKEQTAEELFNFTKVELPQLIEKLDLKALEKLINNSDKEFSTALDHAKELLSCIEQEFPSRLSESFEERSSLIFRFFSNLIDTFISAFNFYNEGDAPTSIYEKQVLIQIYYRFFQIPFTIALLLQPLVLVAWQAYVITVAVLAAATIGIYAYVKWVKPFPTVIHNCENIDQRISKEFQSSIRGLDSEMERLISSLSSPIDSTKKTPIMLLAETGNGKTTLILKLHQMIKEGKVPSSLKEKKIVFIHGGQLMAESSTYFSEKIKEIRHRLSGYEKDAIIFIDEIQSIAQNPVCFEVVKNLLRTPEFQFIAATTDIAFKGIKEIDKDSSFCDSFDLIQFEKKSDSEVKSILQEIAEKESGLLSITDKAIEIAIELTKEGSLRKTIGLLRRAVNICLKNYAYPPLNPELVEKKIELEELKRQVRSDLKQEKRKEKKALEKEISELENEQKKLLEHAQFVQQLIIEKNRLKQQLYQDASKIALDYEKGKKNESLKKHYLFSCYTLIPELDKLINEKIAHEKFKGTSALQVNEELIKALFDEGQKQLNVN